MTRPDAINPLDDSFIDRIVDGALTPAELRAAIGRLDSEPDGWKRCALAFLEAQCWRESVRAMGQPTPSTIESRSLSVAPAIPSRTWGRRRWLRGSIAAGLAAASFAMGWVGHEARSLPSSSHGSIAGVSTNPIPPGIGSQSGSLNQTRDDDRPATHLAAWLTREERSLPTVKEVVRSVGRVHIGDESTGAEVPILAGPGITEQWLRDQPPPLDEHREVALQRQGYQVDQRRRLVKTTLADGRRVTVPIDQVQIRYTGNNPL
jgi:hypothetical protein